MTNQPHEALHGAQQSVEQEIAAARATALSGQEAGYGGHLATFDVVQLPAATEEQRDQIRADVGLAGHVGRKPSMPLLGQVEVSDISFMHKPGGMSFAETNYPGGSKRTGTGF